MRSEIIKKIITLTLSLSLTVASVMAIPNSSASADSESELKSKIEQYEKKQKEIQSKIDALEDEKADAEDVLSAVREKVANLEAQITAVNSRISSINAQMSKYESDIAEKEAEIEDAKDTLKARLRAIYIAGSSSELEVILGADDFADFLAKSELMRGVTDHDTELMDSINAEIAEINEMKAGLEASKKEADQLKQTLVSKQNELDTEYSKAKSTYNSISSEQSDLEDESAEIAAAKKKAEAEWEEIISKSAQQNQNLEFEVVQGTSIFAWPVQAGSYISSHFGSRWGTTHGGTDICFYGGAYGKPIYAAAAGTVIAAGWNNGGYGNYVIIDHGVLNGNRYTTLYAHASSVCVSAGQTVSQGTHIANIGNTGQSFGAHLHFEVRVNGTRVNPMNYF
ncbi:MAG: peptidoglycan DD-metalloendopeptidase family protein [Clostridia bacterium]|nr:peptidoglycan DD-metalloendopeptidase family protein [Clostridia bacterium]